MKTFNKSASIHTNEILLSSNRLELPPWSFTLVFKTIETIMRWNCISKALRFLQITATHQDCPVFTVIISIKTSFQNISFTLLQISFKGHEHRGGYWRKKFQLGRYWPWKTLLSHLKWVHTWHVVVLRVWRRLCVVGSSMDSLVALQTQSGSAESETDGALELRCCDFSRGCSVRSFIGRHEFLSLWVHNESWNQLVQFGFINFPIRVVSHIVLFLDYKKWE